ncbi:MAG: TonB-dependent receptor [Acetobacter malorum]|uniref:TonB-dependent receptor plug domain-containing protein n=1 Tax=Acetobacter malorum TaxID=178901 RepID=UPI0039E7A921
MRKNRTVICTAIVSFQIGLGGVNAYAAVQDDDNADKTKDRRSSLVRTGAKTAPSGTVHQARRRAASLSSKEVPASSSETMIITGTHAFNRRARDSTAPISILTGAQLRQTGQMNVADAITRLDPSITMQAVGGDAGALTSSIRMRGLNPNEVLVLVDGKRRHTTANIYADNGPQQGGTPVDLNMIPANAIDHIEILRDGAAAMYGSDAIAGVVNIILKKTDHGLHVSAQTGANAYTGNGWNYQVNADGGLKFGDDGYVHISGSMYHTDHMYPRTVDFRSQPNRLGYAGYSFPSNSNKVISTPEETRENLSIKFGKTLFSGVKGYGLITYAHRHAETYENFRLPSVLPAVKPNGFTPIETMNENDFSGMLGLTGDNLLGFSWELSPTYGEDDDRVNNPNTVNIKLYKYTGYTPTTVTAQSYSMAQWTNDLGFRRRFNIGHVVPMTLAFGGQHRLEMYNLYAGEPASYLYGGTQAFGGIIPENAGKWDRDIWAGYLDGDFHPLKHWDLDFAGRFEHYTDTGNTENGKISTRYDFTKRIAIRGTISNGFRAPTLAEEHYSEVNIGPTNAGGLLASSSDAAKALGANHLKPERSTSAEAGILLEPVDRFHISVDVYQINIRDRIAGGGTVRGQAAHDAILQTGASIPPGVLLDNTTAYYFANVGSTRTQGIDISGDYLFRFENYGNLDLSASLNLNRTRMSHINTDQHGSPVLNAQNVSYLTTASPRSKIILNARWTFRNWDINLRETRYGLTSTLMTYEDQTPASSVCPLDGGSLRYSVHCFGQYNNTPVWLTDLEVGYHINSRLHVAVGANNIFNQRPRRLQDQFNYVGANIYDFRNSGIPITGGYYYGRVNVDL